MRFDKFSTDSDAWGDRKAEEIVPDGTHECRICKVGAWNGQLIVELTVVDANYSPWTKFLNPDDKDDHALAMQLCDALGIPRDSDIGVSLVGQHLRVTTKQARKNGEQVFNKKGDPIVYTNAFLPSGIAPPKPAATPRTGAAKVAKAQGTTVGDADDVPF